ncbi:hypothetical protein ABH961_001974 [Bacillus sp. RC251]
MISTKKSEGFKKVILFRIIFHNIIGILSKNEEKCKYVENI